MICFNGQLCPPEAARVSIFDRGFLYGDGLFETLPVYDNCAFLLGEHIDRLQRGARALRFSNAPTSRQWEDAVAALLQAQRPGLATLRLFLSRGCNTAPGLGCTAATNPTWACALLPARRYPHGFHAQGARLARVDRIHALPEQLPTAFKHSNYLASILAFDDAQADGADEALLLNPNGNVCEGAYSNLFFVMNGRLLTPALSEGPLAGIVRAKTIELAGSLSLVVEETAIPFCEIGQAQECFLTGSLSGIVPVRQVAEVAFDAPGPITTRLSQAYAELVHTHTGFRWPPAS